MKFSSEHLDAIQEFVEQSPISRSQMRENIIDHLCCAVEYRLLNGVDFEEALESSITEFAPNGLKEIEHETHLLLNYNSIFMKKITYGSGFAFSFMASVGIFFKILHYTGANELVILGFGGLAAIFIPLLSLTRNVLGKPRMEKIRETIFLISLLFLSIGAVLKIFHVAGANETLLLGTAGFSLGFLPLTFIKLYKEAVAA